MQASFSIAVDPDGAIIRVVMAGFFAGHDIARFAAARKDAHRLLRCAPNQHRTLVDIRGMKIQAQSSVDDFARLLSDPAYTSRQLAFVVEPGLARAQIFRAAAGRGAHFFLSPAEAEAWLSSTQAPQHDRPFSRLAASRS